MPAEMRLPRAVVMASAPEGGLYRRLRLGRPTSEAHGELVRAYRAPGQYVLVAIPGDADDAVAPFALARAPAPGAAAGPDAPEALELLVKPVGPVAEALVTLPVGAEVTMSDPLGEGFAIERARGGDVMLLAAGSGIGPVRSVVDTLCRERSAYGFIRLYYGQQRAEHFAYRTWLGELAGHGVEVALVTSAESAPAAGAPPGVPVHRGYVQGLADVDANFTAPERLTVVLCGMPAMEDDARERLAARGLPAVRVLTNL